ncbi:MAG: hypothetical protein ACRENJ_09020 [Candidatus Eiseniibacteriota bacterium]
MSTAIPAGPEAGSRRARLTALVVFAAAMGWLEGVVVVYIRGLFGMGHGAPIPPPGDVVERFSQMPWLLPTEQGREMATLVMLAVVAWLGASRLRARIGAFLIIFGTWDIVYYIALWVMLRWPPSLATMDVLFLVPPSPFWNQPVWVPVSISAVMIAVGARLFLGGGRQAG